MNTMTQVRTRVGTPSRPVLAALAFLGCAALAIALMAWRYVGFQSSDDANYVGAALNWLHHFPYVGDSHWTLRHPIALPLAASIALFGVKELAVSLPAALYFLATLAVLIFFASRFIGLWPAVAGAVLMTTLPGFVILATYMNADLVELFYMTVAFWAFVAAVERPDRRWPLLLSGASAALGFLTRETSAAFVLFVGLMFLFRPLMPRRNYFVIALGFLAVIGVEWAYLTAMTGNPLYRIHIDEQHDTINRAAELARARERGSIIDAEGNVSVSVWIDPVLNLLVTQKYGLLYWVGIPAMVLLWRSRPSPPVRARALLLMLGFAIVWFAFVALNPKLYLVPRYLVVTASLFAMAAGWWLVEEWRGGRRARVGLIVAAMLAVSTLGLLVENINPRFAERQLADFAAAHPGQVVYTDSDTALHAHYFFSFRGMDMSRVSYAMPGPDALVFYNEEARVRCARTFRCQRDLTVYRPKPDWEELGRVDIPHGPVARLVMDLALERFLPSEVARKITQPVTPIVLYRVPASAPEKR
jgi:4-amino-4-deoxy-L-arabinose transferase-like glycosyltransferase